MGIAFGVGLVALGAVIGYVACGLLSSGRAEQGDRILLSLHETREQIGAVDSRVMSLKESLDKSAEEVHTVSEQNKELRREKADAEQLAKLIGTPGPGAWRGL